ncbi:MAG: squalene/phytoene synthase family protein [Pseudomonadota bacterium]|jgi:phytoene synthase|nr:squalene/phytoene synthase family protein [Pseudomonadota bacterium]
MQKSYAQDIVQTHDYTRYLVSLSAKSYAQKQALWALFAFNYEVARTREIVSDTTIGLIRLTWWRDALKAIYDMPTEHKRSLDDHPILPELADAIKTFALPYDLFDELLLGREFDLEDLQPETLDGLITYIKNTNGPLLKLTARICGSQYSEIQLEKLASANGLIGIISAVPYHAQHNIAMLPKENIDKDAIMSANTEKLVPTLSMICQEIQKLLKDIKQPPKGVIKSLYKLTKIHLHHIEKSGFDPTTTKFQKRPSFLALKMSI